MHAEALFQFSWSCHARPAEDHGERLGEVVLYSTRTVVDVDVISFCMATRGLEAASTRPAFVRTSQLESSLIGWPEEGSLIQKQVFTDLGLSTCRRNTRASP